MTDEILFLTLVRITLTVVSFSIIHSHFVGHHNTLAAGRSANNNILKQQHVSINLSTTNLLLARVNFKEVSNQNVQNGHDKIYMTCDLFSLPFFTCVPIKQIGTVAWFLGITYCSVVCSDVVMIKRCSCHYWTFTVRRSWSLVTNLCFSER